MRIHVFFKLLFLKDVCEVLFSWIMSNFAKLLLGKVYPLKVPLVIFLYLDMVFLLSNFRILFSTLQEHNWKEKTGALLFTFLLIYIMFWWLEYFLLIPWRRSMLSACLVSIFRSFWNTLKTINLQIIFPPNITSMLSL